jgi:hypothetical protein
MTNIYQTPTEIEAVVSGFESCGTGKDDFKHREHLTVAVSYLNVATQKQAADKMRIGLLRFLTHHGVGTEKYNETLTMFWVAMVRRTLAEIRTDSSLVEKCNVVIEALGNPSLAFDYYSKELLWSDEARRAYVKPDLKNWEED